MSWLIVSTFLTVASTAYSAKASKEAGKQQQYDLERQADQEKMGAQNQEIQRREKLNKVLASNMASASAMGVSGEGSMQAISLETAKRASSSEGAMSVSDRMRQDLLKREGKAAKSAGKTQAMSTLIGGAAKGSQLWKNK